MSTATTAGPALLPTQVTVTTDHMGRAYAVIPDTIARQLATAALEGIDRDARGIFFESTRHPADSWAAATVRTVFDAVLASPIAADDDHAYGLNLYRKYDGATFYGFIVGESAWDADTRWWRQDGQHNDLIVRGNATIATTCQTAIAGTCTF